MNFLEYQEEKPIPVMEPTAAERRASAISFIEGSDVEEVELDLLTNGRDAPTNQLAEENSAQRDKEAKKKAAYEISQDTSIEIEDKVQVLDDLDLTGYPDLFQDVRDKALSIPSEREVGQRVQNEATQNLDFLQEIESYRGKKKKNKVLNASLAQSVLNTSYAKGEDVGVVEGVGEIAATILPGAMQVMWNNIHTDLFPDDDLGWIEKISVGSILGKIKDHAATLQGEDLRDFLTQAVESVDSNTFYGTGVNAIEGMFAKQEIMADLLAGEETHLDEILNNVASWMEVVTLGAAGVLRLVPKLTKGLEGTEVGTILKTTNPEAYVDAVKAAEMMTDEGFKKAFGITKEEVVVDSIGSSKFVPGEIIEQHLQAKNLANTLDEVVSNNTLVYSSVDVEQAEKGLKTILSRNYPHVQHTLTKPITDLNTGKMSYEAIMGGSPSNGFSKLSDAVDVVEANISKEKMKDVTFYIRDKDGDLLPLTNKEVSLLSARELQASFFYGIKGDIPVMTALSVSGRTLTKEDILKPWAFSGMMEGVFDNAAMFSQRISRHIDNLQNESAAIGGRVREVFKPFSDATQKDKNVVLDKISELVESGEEFNYAWLLSQGFTQKQLTAAVAFKETGDTMHHLAGASQYRKAFSEGQKKISTNVFKDAPNREKFDFMGKPLTLQEVKNLDSGLVHYYNPNTKAVETLSQKQLSELYESGAKLVQSKQFHGEVLNDKGIKVTSNLVVIDDLDRVSELPLNPLNYDTRYVAPQVYDAPIFIRQQKTIIKNGKEIKYWQAVKTADTWEQAAKDVAEMGDDFRATYSREVGDVGDGGLYAATREDAIEEIAIAQGRLFFSKRGERLPSVDGHSAIKNPVTSMLEGIDRLSNNLVRKPAIDQLKVDLMTNFRPYLANQKEYPRDIKAIVGASVEADKARMLWRKIDDLEKLSNFKSMEGLRKGLLKASMRIGYMQDSSKFRGYTSRALLKASEYTDIAHLGKALAFRLFIAGSPTRQLFVQGQQWMMLSPLVLDRMPKIMGDYMGLINGMSRKAMGLDVSKETRHIMKQLNDSGFLKTIDQHAHLDGKSTNTKVWKEREVSEVVSGVLDIPFRIGKEGFINGERINRVMTWLVARERFFKEHKKYPTTQRELQGVTAEAMQLTGAITRDSAYSWQKGLLGGITQFMSVQMKMASLMVPWTGSKALSDWDKVRVMAGQVALHGSQGFGLANVADNMLGQLGIQVTPEERAALLGGAIDYAYYKVMNENKLFSASMSAASGVPSTLSDTLGAIFGLNGKNWLDTVPAVAAGSKVIQSFKDVKFMYYAMDNNDPAKKATYISDAILNSTSGWSNYTAAMGTYKYQDYMSKSGKLLGLNELNKFDLIRGMFGVQTRGEVDFYKLMEKKGITEYSDPQFEWDQDVKAITKEYKRFLRLYNQDPKTDYTQSLKAKEDFARNIEYLSRALAGIHGEERGSILLAEARIKLANEEPRQLDGMLNVLFNHAISGKDVEDKKELLTIVANMYPNIDEEKQSSFKQALEDLLEGED